MSTKREAEAMEHPGIDDEHIIDRYLAGRLGEEDEARFEEHLFECARCFEQVQAGEELRRGLQAMATEEVARATVAVGLMAWLRGRRPGQLAGLALAFLLLPTFLLWQHLELRQLRSQMQQDPQQASLSGPMSDFLVVSMGVVRDSGDAVEIRLNKEKDAILLSLELSNPDAPFYRATLYNAEAQVLWQGQKLEPNLYDTLLVALPSSFLKPGSYRIALEGLTSEGSFPAGEMRFRVLPGQ